jgi:hypothetical protein
MGLRGIRVTRAVRSPRAPDPTADPRYQAAEAKRARKRRRNLELIVAGGMWAPPLPDAGGGP